MVEELLNFDWMCLEMACYLISVKMIFYSLSKWGAKSIYEKGSAVIHHK